MRQQRASCVSVHGEEGVLASRVERGRHPVGSVDEAGQSSRASPLGIVSQPSPFALWLPCEWRRRRGSWVVLVVLVGVGAGAVLGIASGACWTDSAYGRFVAQSSPADLMVASGYVGLGPTTNLGKVAKLPGVRSTSTDLSAGDWAYELGISVPTVRGCDRRGDRWAVRQQRGSLEDPLGSSRDPRRLDEAVASFEFARRFHVGVGDTVDLRFLPLATRRRLLPAYLARLPDYAAGRALPPGLASVFDGPHVTVQIVGVEAAPYEFPPQGIVLPPLVMTPAFYQKYAKMTWCVRASSTCNSRTVPMLERSRPECRSNWERTHSRPRPRRPPMSSGRFTSKPACCGDWRCSSPSRPW